MSTFKENSKQDWIGARTIEHINAGSLQRIADACERMAENYIALQNERDRYKRWYAEEAERLAQERRRTAALRGVVNRMKREQK